MLNLIAKSQFKKDLKRCKKRNKDINKLKLLIDLLLHKKDLPKKYYDHNLTGIYKDYKECHIEPDWLIIYKMTNNNLILVRTGSHADLFK